jgi:hypothetical protein
MKTLMLTTTMRTMKSILLAAAILMPTVVAAIPLPPQYDQMMDACKAQHPSPLAAKAVNACVNRAIAAYNHDLVAYDQQHPEQKAQVQAKALYQTVAYRAAGTACDMACISALRLQARAIFGNENTTEARQWIAVMVSNKNGVDLQIGQSRSWNVNNTRMHCPAGYNCYFGI